ncbi:hypothetical protein VNO78_25603 [Psophocarpus tetragonolobus]|uniref:TIR domain-containing protein n=1 Tax=Psophocarpus tetragonolobus TaxID=3891 RepID=A0AAN9XFK6_PSOTE
MADPSSGVSAIKHVLFLCLLFISELNGEGVATSQEPSDEGPQIKYDVFVNFRGEDIRHGFLGYLTEAFHQKQIHAFVDDNLEKGDEIWPSLVEAIKGSLISLTIFSGNYSSSHWCLEELVTILECREKYGQTVIPVFFHVNPTDVRHQKESYGKALAEHENKYGLSTVQNWRNALKKAADLSGVKSSDHKAEVNLLGEIINIVNLVLKRSDKNPINLKRLIGIDRPMQRLESMIHQESKDVRVIEMGWEIVRQESIEEPGKRSRLWDPDDVYEVLKNNKGTESIRSIRADVSVIRKLKLSPYIFTKMTKLRFLYVPSEYDQDDFHHFPHGLQSFPDELTYLDGLQSLPTELRYLDGLQSFSDELRYLVWRNYPLRSLPENFSSQNLVLLDLTYSHVEKLWDGVKNLKSLKEVKVTGSVNLKELPDLSEATNLEVLDISGCVQLTSVTPSIFSLNKLKILKLDYHSFSKIIINNHISSLSFFTVKGSIEQKEISLRSENIISNPVSCMCLNLKPSSFICKNKLETLSKITGSKCRYLQPSTFKELRRQRYLRVLDPRVICLIELGPVYLIDCLSLKNLLSPAILDQQFKNMSCACLGIIQRYHGLVGASVVVALDANSSSVETVFDHSEHFDKLKTLSDHK